MKTHSDDSFIPSDFTNAVKDIKLAILSARTRAARLANAEALKLYFYVGGYVSKKTRTAKWGSGAIEMLSKRLQVELPGLRGFSTSSIVFMRLFYEAWHPYIGTWESDEPSFHYLASNEMENAAVLRPQSEETKNDGSPRGMFKFIADFLAVGFTHHREIIRFCKDIEERIYYIRACANGQWSVSALLAHLRADDYHHVGTLPNNFEKTLSPMALATRAVRSFRDEYLLDFVNLDNADALREQDVDERVLSRALVADVEKTIQSLGGDDFCFMGREKRLVYSDEEFFIDLLFYHRGLRAMVAVELKMGKFRPSYLGQLNFYLSALDCLMRKDGENPSVGLLLCEEMNRPVVQLAVQDVSKPIGVATYRTLKSIPQPYRSLAPVMEGVRRVMVENAKERATLEKGGAK